MSRRLRDLAGDRSGGALVEMVLVAPVLILLLFGSVSLVDAFDAQRRVDHVAYAIADLVAQDKTVSKDDVDAIFAGGQALVDPLAVNGLGQRIASFTADGDGGVGAPDWHREDGAYLGGAPPPPPPPGFLKPSQSVIVAESTYRYAPLSTLFLPITLSFHARAMLRPRVVDQIPYTGP